VAINIKGTEAGDGKLYDIILAADETEDVEGTWVGLRAFENPETGAINLVEGRIPPFGARQSQGQVGLEDRDPLTHLIWKQDDWSAGALVESADLNNKGYIDSSMDPMFEGYVGPGIARNFGTNRGNDTAPIGVVLVDPFFEAPAAKTGWTDDSSSNGTVTFGDSTNPRTELFGSQDCKIVSTATGDMISQVVANHVQWRGKVLTFACYLRRTAGSGSIRVKVTDSAGSTTGTVITASGYTRSTVNHTVNGSASSLKVVIEATDAGTFYADDASVYVGSSLAGTRVVEHAGSLYAGFGRMVCQLRTGTVDKFVWDAVYVGPSDVTDLIEYEGSSGNEYVYAAYGGSNPYIYGGDASWTASTLSGTNDNAIYFAKSRDTLWKSETSNTIKSATNPENGGSWSSVYTIGGSDHAITRLHGHNDTIMVGKEDGFWVYRRVYNDGGSANIFENQTNEYASAPHSDNFSNGAPYKGSLYMNTGTHGFARIIGGSALEELNVFDRPQAGAKGVVRAIAGDAHQLWCVVDNSLYSVIERGNDLIPHRRSPTTSMSSQSATEFGAVTANSGAKNAGTGTNRNSAYEAWSNVSNISSSNNAYATVAHDSGLNYSDHLQATNFSFTIPTDATIKGVYVRIERKASHNTGVTSRAVDQEVKLLKGGVQTGDNKADTATIWPTSDTYKTYGSSSDMWGTTLTPSDVNASTFGVELQIWTDLAAVLTPTSSVDHIEMTVYYERTPQQTEQIVVHDADVAYWTVSGADTPHLLVSASGLDDTDSVPYAFTDSFALPRTAVSPTLDADDLPASPTTQYFRTSRWSNSEPTEKYFATKLDVRMDDMDGTQPVTVKFGKDGADPSSGTTLGTLEGSNAVQTLYFGSLSDAEDALFHDISFYFEGTYTGTKNKRSIRGFEFHCVPLFEDVPRIWQIDVAVGGAHLHNGSSQDDERSRAALIQLLRNFETKKVAWKLIEDFDGDGEATAHSVMFRVGQIRVLHSQEGEIPSIGQVWTLVMHEIKNTS
jgi:hypothetical protein